MLTWAEHLREHPVAPLQWQVRPLAVLLASGPSLTQEDVDLCRRRARVLAINDSWRLAPWADVLYAADPEWWDFYKGVPGFTGQKWTQDRKSAERWGLSWVAGAARPGLSFDRGLIHTGSNSGYQALNLAIHFGATRIILLGYDMQETGGKSHWHGDHPGGLNRVSNYKLWIEKFKTTVADLERNRIQVVNCSRATALDCFKRAELLETLCNSSAGSFQDMALTEVASSPTGAIT